MTEKIHKPVMLQEVINYFAPCPSKLFLDCTFGRGGHTQELLSYGAAVFASDRDENAFYYAKQFECSTFAVRQAKFSTYMDYNRKFDGVLFDFGLSSDQIEDLHLGISFNSSAPLNMEMGMNEKSLYSLVNSSSEQFLADVIYRYGEEHRSRRIAKAIYEARRKRKIEYTNELVSIIEKIVPRGAIHPATKTFQAFRIYVNDELNEIIAGLQQAFSLLKDGGKLICISFHSLEDRLVKEFAKIKGIVKSELIFPSKDEARINRRSRSAKLRVLIKSRR